MNNQLKLLFYIVLIVGIFYFIQDRFKLLDISFLDGKISINNNKDSTVDTNTVLIQTKDGKNITVNIERADTVEERALGLAHRTSLGEYSGMLFIFDEISNTPFTMKDMKIPLDFLFIDKDGVIVDIKQEQSPCLSSTCVAILSNVMYKNVLEVNGGFCEANGIQIGDTVK
jgi:uncharacterized protein